MPTEFHYALAKDRRSRVIPESRFVDVRTAEADGWEILTDSARSIEDGVVHAAVFADALPEDYEDRMAPRPMSEARPLFRSMSPFELVDLLERGFLVGGRSGFNDFEHRPFVFFGGALTENLLAQGEFLDRQSVHAMRHHELHAAFAEARFEDRRLRREAARLIRAEAASVGRTLDDAALDDWAERDVGLPDEVRRTTLPAVRDVLRAGAANYRAAEAMRPAYIADARAWERDRKAEIEGLAMTSAVVETRPLGTGWHYSDSFGRAAFGDEDEFGLYPGQVQADDVVRVHLVRKGSVYATLEGHDAIAEACAEAGRPLAASSPSP